jgi:hypothetical protein
MLVGDLGVDGDHALSRSTIRSAKVRTPPSACNGLAVRARADHARREDAAEHLRALVGLDRECTRSTRRTPVPATTTRSPTRTR